MWHIGQNWVAFCTVIWDTYVEHYQCMTLYAFSEGDLYLTCTLCKIGEKRGEGWLSTFPCLVCLFDPFYHLLLFCLRMCPCRQSKRSHNTKVVGTSPLWPTFCAEYLGTSILSNAGKVPDSLWRNASRSRSRMITIRGWAWPPLW